MTKGKVEYSKGYRYQLKNMAVFETGILGFSICTEFVTLSPTGTLWLRSGYATDGVTGITGSVWAPLLERKWLIYGSFGHDGLYQLMRLRLLPSTFRPLADRLLKEWCLSAKAPQWQADAVLFMVENFGRVTDPDREILIAP